MKLLLIAYFFSLLLLFTGCTNAKNDFMNSFYFPFHAQTFTPITELNIEIKFKKKLQVLEGDKLFNLLVAAHKNGKPFEINKNLIRFKYESGKNKLLIDSSGVIFFNGVSRKCSVDSFSEIEKLIQEAK